VVDRPVGVGKHGAEIAIDDQRSDAGEAAP
jgi:hypothetical protein